ncbi:MAG TPA: DNA polymerase III subunit delta [Bacteroidales bacterium]|nr:DNA polymerase III subunit delta [Bacteroidales bacterium]
MKFEDILSDLKNKIYKPVYFLHGEEEYFIDIITDYIARNVLEEADREFNQTILYGKDVDAGLIIDTARRYPMMSNYQVVIVKEAQEIRNIDDLSAYIEKPVESTILVICYKHKTYDQRRLLARSAQKTGVMFRSDRLYDNKIPAWINAQLKAEGYSITPEAARLLTASLGSDLTKIRMELTKLILNLKPGASINEDIIEQNIGISKEFNIFELQKAMGAGDIYRTNLIIRHFAANPKANPFVLTITLLYQFFVKILIYHALKEKSKDNSVAAELSVAPYFVRDYRDAARRFTPAKTIDAISLLREYDLKFKGWNNASTGEGELLKEMIFKIMH